MRDSQLKHLGERLAAAWKTGNCIDDIAADELPQNRLEAYSVQDFMAQAISDELSGWKVGATSALMRELDGHDDVIPGRIFTSVTWTGHTVILPASRFPNARVETEFAFQLQRDLPVSAQPWHIDDIAPYAVLHPAIEIIGNRHTTVNASAPVRSLMTIADNGGGIGFVFGDAVEKWHHYDFQNHIITLQVDDGSSAENFLGDMRCNPIQAVVDLANHLNSRGIGLFRGDFVSTGAATVPQPVHSASRVTAHFGNMGRIELCFDNTQ